MAVPSHGFREVLEQAAPHNEGRSPEEAFRGLMRRRPTTELAAG